MARRLAKARSARRRTGRASQSSRRPHDPRSATLSKSRRLNRPGLLQNSRGTSSTRGHSRVNGCRVRTRRRLDRPLAAFHQPEPVLDSQRRVAPKPAKRPRFSRVSRNPAFKTDSSTAVQGGYSRQVSGRSAMVWDLVGYLAAAMVLVAFYQTQTVPLRIAAIGSNLAFIVYGLALGLMSVWVLHFLLLGLNTRRLVEAFQVRQRSTRQSPRQT